MCGRCNSSYYGEVDRHVKIRSREYIGISPLTFGRVKPSKESAIRDHLLIYNNISSFDKFTILAYGHHKYILEIKESLLIKCDRPVLNKNISSAKLFLLAISRTWMLLLYHNIVSLCYLICWLLLKLCKLQHFEIEFKKIDFINVTQFHDNKWNLFETRRTNLSG